MKIVFYVFDLTHFKSFGPVLTALKHDGVKDITFLFTRRNNKYNGFGSEKNYNIFLEFANFFEAKIHNVDVEPIRGQYDFIFTVENQDFNCLQTIENEATQIIIQNGFDYTCIKNQKSHFKQKFVLASKDYEQDYRKTSNLPCVYLPIPITYCDWENSKKFGEKFISNPFKNVHLFYPESGYVGLVDGLISKIVQLGFTVSIKQRRKNQTVAINNNAKTQVFYDEQWYPSEAIFLPLNSICSVGFGTSAYVDATVAGLNFIDVPLPDYAKRYVKPSMPNFTIIDVNEANIIDCIVQSILRFAETQNLPTPPNTNYEQLLGSLLT